MYLVLIGCAVLSILVLIFYIFLPHKKRFQYRYFRKESIMTGAEQELFRHLTWLYGEKYCIFPQIHLDSIFGHTINGQSWKGALSHIDRKSVDFVMSEKVTNKIVLGIECDDKSHQRPDRIIRDREVMEIFTQVGLPLIRIPNHGRFVDSEIASLINPHLGL